MMKDKEKKGREGCETTLADARNPRKALRRGEPSKRGCAGGLPGTLSAAVLPEACGARRPSLPYVPPPGAGTVDVRRLLHWAIGHQRAHLAARAQGKIAEEAWVKASGIDSSRMCAFNDETKGPIDRSPAWLAITTDGIDEDAEKIHDQVQACIREWRLYQLIIEHAFAGSEPNWYPGARCGLVPVTSATGQPVIEVDYAQERKGVWRGLVRVRAGRSWHWVEQEVVGAPPASEGWRYVGSVKGERIAHRYTPLVRHDDPEDVHEARRVYSAWWTGLAHIAGALNLDAGKPRGLARWSQVTHTAPRHPWPEADDVVIGRLAAWLRLRRKEERERGWHAPTDGGFSTTGVQPLDRQGAP